MPPKTVRRALINMLEDLDGNQFSNFCGAILDRKEDPRVRRSALGDRSPGQIADALITTYTESTAVDVALETLEEITCNEQRKRFAEDVDKVQLTPVSSYGDIMMVETTGASLQTAKQDNLKCSGVKASHAMAETDLIEINKYKPIIKTVACQKGVDPALIAAIISRSCRAGKTLTDGWGCYDENTETWNTFGLMQIDVNPNGGGHKVTGLWNSKDHLCQATDILIGFIIHIKHRFENWTKEQQLKGGIAAYNAGDLMIESYEKVDANTSCGDYSNDVVARAQWYKTNGGF